ncbi:MAG: RNA 2',3'-cyclic phosphodiesterase [Chloroflexi bacterium]|nr:RNA 2',3'-cyclic phosphodiesterase [Chloroflexota bacterium]
MAVLRAFIATELPDEFHEKLEHVSRNLQAHLKGLPLRWVPVENIHLTLKFLGDVSEASLEMVFEILKTHAGSQQPFDISIGGLGVYPNMKHPRVAWVGVEAPDELEIFQRRIDTETARLGYAPDKRTYSAHLTVGRVSRSANSDNIRMISQVLQKEKVGFLGVAHISEICLFRSELKPGGAVYTRLFSTPFMINNSAS